MLDGGDDVSGRRVDDENSARRGRRDVDIVDAHARAAHDREVRRRGQERRVDLRRLRTSSASASASSSRSFSRGRAGELDDLVPRLPQDVQAGRRDLLRDDDAAHAPIVGPGTRDRPTPPLDDYGQLRESRRGARPRARPRVPPGTAIRPGRARTRHPAAQRGLRIDLHVADDHASLPGGPRRRRSARSIAGSGLGASARPARRPPRNARPPASRRGSGEKRRGLVRRDRHRVAASASRSSTSGTPGSRFVFSIGDLGVALAEERTPRGASSGADGLLEEPLEPPPDHAADPLERQRRDVRAPHREPSACAIPR